MATFASRLAQLRKEAKLTQHQLADKLMISYGTGKQNRSVLLFSLSVFHANFIGIFIGKTIFTSVFFAGTHRIESVRFGIKIKPKSA